MLNIQFWKNLRSLGKSKIQLWHSPLTNFCINSFFFEMLLKKLNINSWRYLFYIKSLTQLRPWLWKSSIFAFSVASRLLSIMHLFHIYQKSNFLWVIHCWKFLGNFLLCLFLLHHWSCQYSTVLWAKSLKECLKLSSSKSKHWQQQRMSKYSVIWSVYFQYVIIRFIHWCTCKSKRHL